MIDDKNIILLNGKIKNLSIQHIKSCYPDEYRYVLNRFDDSESFRESWCRILFGIIERPVCKICGKRVNFIGYRTSKKENLYSIGCCNKHRQLCQETISKAKSTFMKNYGVTNPNKCKYIRNKIKNTCLEKYGVDHNWKSNESKEKSKQTCLEKYGVEYSFQSENNKLKSKQTWIKKYGVEHPLKSIEVQKNFNHKFQVENTIITKRKNHTFNTSKQEEDLYKKLIDKYGKDDVVRQYKSDVYPFACDFYIKSKDLYIEFQGMWTHGKHPYNKDSEEDNLVLEQWKEKAKTSKFYKNAIETWTVRDVKKRECAKKNNLNYLEFFTINYYIIAINELTNQLENG